MEFTKRCIDMEKSMIKLETQINGVEGKGGVMNEIEDMKKLLFSMHSNQKIGFGFIAALQLILPFIIPPIAKALGL